MTRKVTSLILVISLSATTVMTQQTGNTSLSPFPRGPYLSNVTRNSIVVSWTTSFPRTGAVQYGLTSQYGELVEEETNDTSHSLTLSRLRSSSQYHYRAISGSDTSADFTFYTAALPGEPFVFVVYGDTRSNHVAHVGVLKRMFPSNPRFVINTGDLVASNTIENWDNFFNDICRSTTIGETTPIYSTPGNHENGGMYYGNLHLPRNNPESSEAYYSFDYGDIHCIALNSEISYGVGSPQYTWLHRDLASPAAEAAKFKIAFWHRPPFSSSSHGSDLMIRSVLEPVLESNGVDIVFNGHDHVYERTKSINGTTYIVTGGGGAPLYNFESNNDWTAYRESAFHFCKVTVRGDTLSMYMIRSSDGVIRDSLVVSKGPDTFSPMDYKRRGGPLLHQSYGDRMSRVTTIEYDIQEWNRRVSRSRLVTLRVFDLLGREVATLVNEWRSPGHKSVPFDVTGLSGGVYFFAMRDGNSIRSTKFLVFR